MRNEGLFGPQRVQRSQRGWLHGRGVDGLVYTNSQPYSKRACAFGLRSLSKLLTLTAFVKPEKSLFFLKRINTKRHEEHEEIFNRGLHRFLPQIAQIFNKRLHRYLTKDCTDFWMQRSQRFLAGLVFSVNSALKASF